MERSDGTGGVAGGAVKKCRINSLGQCIQKEYFTEMPVCLRD